MKKYLKMMKSTQPEEYEAQKRFLPFMSAEKIALANEICDEMIAQTSFLRKAYPIVGGFGRPLFSEEDRCGFTSVQTYLLGELLTYSERTLRLLKEHLFALKVEGRSLAEAVAQQRTAVSPYLTRMEAFARQHIFPVSKLIFLPQYSVSKTL